MDLMKVGVDHQMIMNTYPDFNCTLAYIDTLLNDKLPIILLTRNKTSKDKS